MNSVLDYFISLQESQSADMNEQSVEMWNRRAEFWENARKKNQKGNERVVSAINYLEQKGLLDKIMMWQISDADPAVLLLPLPGTYIK